MPIRDLDAAALKAACKAYIKFELGSDVDHVRSIIRAYLAAASEAPSGEAEPVVKGLEWEAREKPDPNGNRYWRAQTPFDWGYRIYFEDNRYVFQTRGTDFATLGEAKAAAQADFETRIRSALATPTQPASPIEQGEPTTWQLPAEPMAITDAMVKALRFYADPNNWIDTPSWDGDPTCFTPKAIPVTKEEDGSHPCDCGDVARAALAAMNEEVAITDAMVEAFKAKYREFWPGSWPDSESSRELLAAASAASPSAGGRG
ncbi:hypothetical protein [Mesorhizobium sp.]|uniref:hypothetical protein n=1 Tax=Mesorhizobium sp. TaxID=1871066 RepID=UPI000FE99D1A|nr:hypothetical protein [Mesorhizobium sp.]RWF33749.1 MAG: hypothetical protein EOS45_02125 [Mesorhizobium sp.]